LQFQGAGFLVEHIARADVQAARKDHQMLLIRVPVRRTCWPAGNLSRNVIVTAVLGSPSGTAIWAPGGNKGGAAPT
jgi:hypothetical protein